MTPSVSIIMTVTNRPNILRNTLKGWSIIDYPDFDFTIIDNGSGSSEIENAVNEFKDKLHISFYELDSMRRVSGIWNEYGKASRGEYVVFAMMDEIISHKDILQKMVEMLDYRSSIFTYFMSEQETSLLETLDWEHDPSIIPKPYTTETTAGLISHITGNYKKNWEWFGWFRDEKGYLWLDQDVYLREVCLGKPAQTPKDVYCLHQYHLSPPIPQEIVTPGYTYHTEGQARLLEPAEKKK